VFDLRVYPGWKRKAFFLKRVIFANEKQRLTEAGFYCAKNSIFWKSLQRTAGNGTKKT